MLHRHYLYRLKQAFERGRQELEDFAHLNLQFCPDVPPLDGEWSSFPSSPLPPPFSILAEEAFEKAWVEARHNHDPPSAPKKRLGLVEGAWMLTLLSIIYWSIVFGAVQHINGKG